MQHGPAEVADFRGPRQLAEELLDLLLGVEVPLRLAPGANHRNSAERSDVTWRLSVPLESLRRHGLQAVSRSDRAPQPRSIDFLRHPEGCKLHLLRLQGTIPGNTSSLAQNRFGQGALSETAPGFDGATCPGAAWTCRGRGSRGPRQLAEELLDLLHGQEVPLRLALGAIHRNSAPWGRASRLAARRSNRLLLLLLDITV